MSPGGGRGAKGWWVALLLLGCGAEFDEHLVAPQGTEVELVEFEPAPPPPWACLAPEPGKFVLVMLRENPLPEGIASCRGSKVEARFGELFPDGFVLGRELAPELGLSGHGYFQPYFLGDLCSADPIRSIPESCEWSVDDAATKTCEYHLHRDADFAEGLYQPVAFHVDRHLRLLPSEKIEVEESLRAHLPEGLAFHPARFRFTSRSIVHDEECELDFDAAWAQVPEEFDVAAAR